MSDKATLPDKRGAGKARRFGRGRRPGNAAVGRARSMTLSFMTRADPSPPVVLGPADEPGRAAQTDRAGELLALRVVTMRQAGTQGAGRARLRVRRPRRAPAKSQPSPKASCCPPARPMLWRSRRRPISGARPRSWRPGTLRCWLRSPIASRSPGRPGPALRPRGQPRPDRPGPPQPPTRRALHLRHHGRLPRGVRPPEPQRPARSGDDGGGRAVRTIAHFHEGNVRVDYHFAATDLVGLRCQRTLAQDVELVLAEAVPQSGCAHSLKHSHVRSSQPYPVTPGQRG